MGDVRGRVTLDGQPIANGTVRFSPLDGRSPTAGGRITNGDFQTLVPVANHRVQISAAQLPPGGIPADPEAFYTIKELVPSKYNTDSELTLDVKEGKNEPQFDLKSR